MAIQVVQPGDTRTRTTRTPNFPIAGTIQPQGVYPLCAVPVLPGETLTRMQTRIRLISKPIAHPLVGSWYEGWMFYVKLTDLDRALGEMFIRDDVSTDGHTAAATKARFFTTAGQIDWVQKCYDRIIEAYFVNEGETAPTIDGVAMAKLQNMWWGQNLVFQEVGQDPAEEMQELQDGLDPYQMARMMGMSELTYEQYLKQYGVQTVKTEIGKPEVLRYWRSWTQPTNAIDPATGAPSSALAWSEDIKAEKDIYFREPGFLVCLQTVRPKFYLPQLTSSMVGELWGFSDWFPAHQLKQTGYGVKPLSSLDGLFQNVNGDAARNLWYDRSDFLSHGEQFVNDWTDGPRLPTANGISFAADATRSQQRGEYPLPTDIDGLFKSSATRADKIVYYEGICQMTIRGHIQDQTPRGA